MFIRYISDFFTVKTISILTHLKMKEQNMSPYKFINILMLAIPCLTVNDNTADLFKSDYNIIYYTYWIVGYLV